MTRTVPPAFLTALGQPELRPRLFFEGEFATGWVRLWSGLGAITWGGRDWAGAGVLLGIGEMEETLDVVAAGTSVSLSGVPLDLVQGVIDEAQQGAVGRIYLGLMDEADALICDPVLVFGGRLDVPSITDGAESSTITISYESRLVDLQTPRELRYTHESQQLLYPGDLGFEYVASIQDREIRWGR